MGRGVAVPVRVCGGGGACVVPVKQGGVTRGVVSGGVERRGVEL